MTRHLFWLTVAIAAGIAAHAAFTLFVPEWLFSREVGRIAAGRGTNTFFILTPEDQARLLPGLPRQGVTGVCLYDVSAGDVTFAADLPDGLWITTIYTDKAQPVYSVNNRQSGANTFTVSLSRAPGLVESLIEATNREKPEIDSGWTVMSPEPRGLVVVWYPLAEAGLRQAAAESVGRSRCLAAAPHA
jgi:uncharacterized membrane protein